MLLRELTRIYLRAVISYPVLQLKTANAADPNDFYGHVCTANCGMSGSDHGGATAIAPDAIDSRLVPQPAAIMTVWWERLCFGALPTPMAQESLSPVAPESDRREITG